MPQNRFFKSANLLSSTEAEIAKKIVDWTRDFLVPNNPGMRRYPNTPAVGEAVCPFVRSSLKKDLYFFDFNYEVKGENGDAIFRAMMPYIDIFPASEEETDKDDVSLVVVFPKMPEANQTNLHEAHSMLKPEFVKAGLMLAEFFPTSDRRSFHNKDLLVYQAPYPMFAIRYMAPHDILFLGDDAKWFEKYDRQFAWHWEDEGTISPHNRHLLDLYKAAKKRFG